MVSFIAVFPVLQVTGHPRHRTGSATPAHGPRAPARRDRDGTLVFVEVRSRASNAFGGAGASIGAIKQRRIVFAARHYLLRMSVPPPCRFDVVLVQDSVQWLKAAFDAQ